jgi:hypothetical protein
MKHPIEMVAGKVLGLFLSFFAFSAHSNPNVLKIHSSLCGSMASNNTLRGSGVLIRDAGKHYVLTSEHVIFHQNDGFCHFAENKEIGKIRLNLIVADWGTGLALLGAPKNLSQLDGYDTQRDFVEVETGAAPISTAGYPYRSHQIYTYGKGDVLNSKSKRHLIAQSPTMIELINSHAEFGMSGGALIYNNRLAGILSHQYLEIMRGAPLGVSEFYEASKKSVQSHILSIPAKFAKTWLDSIFDHRLTQQDVLYRDAFEQLKSKTAIRFGNLHFTLEGSTRTQPGEIGGADGYGIGGADGVGIGGSSQDSETDSQKSQGVVVKVVRSANPTKHRAPKDHFSEIDLFLLRGRDVRIPFFVDINEESILTEAIYFSSLAEFFTLYFRRGTQLRMIVDRGSYSDQSLGPDLQSFAKKVTNLLIQLESKIGPEKTTLDAEGFFLKLKLLAKISTSENYFLVNPLQFKDILNANDFWNLLFTTDFELAVELMSNIRELERLIAITNL